MLSIVSKSNLRDLGIERLKPLDEQAIHHDGRASVHFTKNAMGLVSRQKRAEIAASLRQVFSAPDLESARRLYEQASDDLSSATVFEL